MVEGQSPRTDGYISSLLLNCCISQDRPAEIPPTIIQRVNRNYLHLRASSFSHVMTDSNLIILCVMPYAETRPQHE
ncbi:hypothetical protein J6590_009106 [Homalodisca vitripennis]|nr:hypothetical protein J6590_009106 [Homalodisca vitripennis]